MSGVSTPVLTLIVPFFGAAVFISTTVTCCLWRRAARNYAYLSERVAALEARHLPNPVPATVVPVYNMPYGAQYRPAGGPYYPMAVASAPPASINL